MARYEVEWVPIFDQPDGDAQWEYLVESCKANCLWPLVDIVSKLMECSKSEARRLIKDRAITIDDVILDDVHTYIVVDDEEAHVKIGKRNHFRIKLEGT